MCTPSATLTAWAGSWLAGAAAPDDVLDALHAWAPRHRVGAADAVTAGCVGMPWPETETTGLTELLKTVREAVAAPGARLRLVLPVAGDVRGLAAGSPFAAAAVAAGEGLLAGTPGATGVGLVPHRPTAETMQWTLFSEVLPDLPEEISLGEAEYAMREAVRAAADALAALQSVAVGSAADPRALVEAELNRSASHSYPSSMPIRARRVLDSADRVAAILTVAARQPASAPASVSGAGLQEDALRPLWTAIRTARLAAVNSAS
ncbi:hypothetical protein OG921_26040 [Aldersonia sp. NBC_00410]|uniref:hypothetical protein n=1 Tax=Aldersonia sp. NBC_00410 TaxID=2975954 RepID=UPI00225B948A|nr:hypothetical protein [Aldersonia sp. NBC_00410]MCX5046639.1 hypothetical protein [Aldersonia sp. NBC_00410]